jgi:hypothetical protein
MNTPNPVPGWQPSGSTVGSGVGGAVAIIVIAVLESYHLPVSGALAAAITTLCAALAGYLPASGRR